MRSMQCPPQVRRARTRVGLGCVVCALAASAVVAAFTPGPARAEDSFAFAVVPDTQNETVSTGPYFNHRAQWLVDNRTALNLKFMLHVGDMMNWDTPDHIQYERASTGLAILDAAGFPYALTIGNHDTAAVKEGGSAAPGDVNLNLRNTTTFNAYFPTTRHLNYIGGSEANKIDNAYHTFHAGDLDWLVINLELWPRANHVTWGRGVVEAHPNHNVIILTHSYLNSDSTIYQANGGYGDNSPQYVYDNLVKLYPNIRFVFCGHVGSHGYRTDTGVNGNKIYSFLQCYHENSNNPTRIFTINTANGTISTYVYCPYTDSVKTDGSQFTVSGVDWVQSSTPPPPPPPADGPGTGILREVWTDVAGTATADLTADPRYPDSPTSSEVVGILEGPTDAGTEYGSRFRGYVIAPLTGDYVFRVASDDASRLLLNSGGEDPAAATQIASVPGWTDSREWTKYPEQTSATVALSAGSRYYVEVLHKEGDGGDNVAVMWQLPSGAAESPIPGHRLDPWVEPEPRGPFGGAPRPFPGRVEAEDYDTGGEGVAYHDSDPVNSGGDYRDDGVDVDACADTGGGYNVGWTVAGEWIEYTVNVSPAGTYDVSVRVSSPYDGKTARVAIGGVTTDFAVPNTGSWTAWQTVTVGGVSLGTGVQVMRVSCLTDGFNLNWVEVATPSTPPPPPPPPPPTNEAPVVDIVTPVAGDVSGTVDAAATAHDPDVGGSDGSGIANVVFELVRAGANVGALTENFAPYEWSLDTTLYADGVYTLCATANASDGGQATDAVDVTFTNGQSADLDTDSDLLPDWWEILNGGAGAGLDPASDDTDSDGVIDAFSDPDMDGATNLDEFISGTNPADAGSSPGGSGGPGCSGGGTAAPSGALATLAVAAACWLLLRAGRRQAYPARDGTRGSRDRGRVLGQIRGR